MLDDEELEHRYVLCARDTLSYTRSSFLQYVKMGRLPLYRDISEFLETHASSMLAHSLIEKFEAATGGRLIVISYNSSRRRGALVGDFLSVLGVDVSSPLPSTGSALSHSNESICPEMAGCLIILTASVLAGLRDDKGADEFLESYISSLESDEVFSANFIRDSDVLRATIRDVYESVKQRGTTDHLLNSGATLLTREFNRAWRESLVHMKEGHAALMDLERSRFMPLLIHSEQKPDQYLMARNVLPTG